MKSSGTSVRLPGNVPIPHPCPALSSGGGNRESVSTGPHRSTNVWWGLQSTDRLQYGGKTETAENKWVGIAGLCAIYNVISSSTLLAQFQPCIRSPSHKKKKIILPFWSYEVTQLTKSFPHAAHADVHAHPTSSGWAVCSRG